MRGWILMSGYDGFGNDATLDSLTVFTSYKKAYKTGKHLTKKRAEKYADTFWDEQKYKEVAEEMKHEHDLSIIFQFFPQPWGYVVPVPVKIK